MMNKDRLSDRAIGISIAHVGKVLKKSDGLAAT